MKKKIHLIAAAIVSSALLLAACAGASQASAATQTISTPQQALASGASGTSITINQPETTTETTTEATTETPSVPAAGETVPISTEPQTTSNTYIGETAAKKAAFDHAGVAEADVSGLWIELDVDDGITVYEVEFYVGGREYDYTLDAVTGTILEYDYEMEHHSEHDSHHSQSSTAAGTTSGQLTREQAISLALEQVPGATQDNVTKFKTDYDDGRTIYEIKIVYGNIKCEMEMDAMTGSLLEFEYDD